MNGLGRVVVAISAFRADDSVLGLLEQTFAGGAPFAGVIVVDSLGEGELAARIRQQGWPVRYYNAQVNLGSAGNLTRRLELAAELDADWCFAVNHDGVIDPAGIAALARYAEGRGRVGAVFPLRVFTDRSNTVFAPYRSVYAPPTEQRGAPATDEVAWDSSNGALYALEPIRDGVKPWPDLWMGWEDLAFGWSLARAGWKQLRCGDVRYEDNYEYQTVHLLGRRFQIARKPAWYAYYALRNLVLFTRRSGGGLSGLRLVGTRLAREVAFTVLFRSEKRRRLALLARGLVDGLAGKTGKGPVP